MSKESLVFALGLIMFLTPFLGVPRDAKDWITGVIGILVMFCGYQLRRRLFLQSLTKGEERKSNAFAESVVETKPEAAAPLTEETRPLDSVA
jgi:hypothetical protein